MSFQYRQTVVFERGGWLQIHAVDDPEHPITLDDLSFVVSLARRCAEFEVARIARRQAELAAASHAAQLREMPLCWPGFRPLADRQEP